MRPVKARAAFRKRPLLTGCSRSQRQVDRQQSLLSRRWLLNPTQLDIAAALNPLEELLVEDWVEAEGATAEAGQELSVSEKLPVRKRDRTTFPHALGRKRQSRGIGMSV